MGSVIKCLAVYDEPFWRDAGYNGQATVGRPGRAGHVRHRRRPTGRPASCSASSPARRPAGSARADPAQRRAEVLASFARYFGRAAARPADYIEHDWTADQWTRGCYGAHFPPGTWTQFGPALRRPAGPAALGGHRDRDALERLHGRRGPVRPARRRRGFLGQLAAIANATPGLGSSPDIGTGQGCAAGGKRPDCR